jgi:hypothetical protein
MPAVSALPQQSAPTAHLSKKALKHQAGRAELKTCGASWVNEDPGTPWIRPQISYDLFQRRLTWKRQFPHGHKS